LLILLAFADFFNVWRIALDSEAFGGKCIYSGKSYCTRYGVMALVLRLKC